jgi:hypothetical protein
MDEDHEDESVEVIEMFVDDVPGSDCGVRQTTLRMTFRCLTIYASGSRRG